MKKTMSAFLLKSEYDSKLISLYVLNVTDYLFTLILISSGLFIEANPLLSMNIDGIWGFILKCIVPMILLMYLHIRLCTGQTKRPAVIRLLLNVILSYYILINCFHVFWISYSVLMFR